MSNAEYQTVSDIIAERDSLKIDVATLREVVQDRQEATDHCRQLWQKVTDENERLRGEIDVAALEVQRLERLVWSPMTAYPEIERLRKAARYAHAAIKTYHAMYPHRATGALLEASGRLWEVLGDE